MSDDPDAVDPRVMELLQGLFRRLEAFHSGTNGVLERLEAGQKSLRADFLDELGKTRAGVMDKIAELKGEVSAIRDDISVDSGAVDMARKVNDNTREDVRQMREHLSVLRRRLLKIEADIRELKGDP